MIPIRSLRTLLGASLILAASAASVGAKPLKIFLMAGQSNMEGHATVSTIDFLGEDPDPARAALLKKFKPDGKTLVTRDDVWVFSNGAWFDKLQPGLGARKDAAIFLIPVQVPKPGQTEKSYEPGPIANSKFTPEEPEKITAGRTAAKK